MFTPPDSEGGFGKQLLAVKTESNEPIARNATLLDIVFLKRIVSPLWSRYKPRPPYFS